MYNIVVIGGGGVRLAATLGSIQYAIDMNWMNDIHTYIGTSMGAIVSIFLGAGISTVKILYLFSCSGSLDISNISILELTKKFGLVSVDKMNELIKSRMILYGIDPNITLLEYKNKYKKTLIFSTFNITKNQCEYLSYKTYPDMECSFAACISSCIPLYFIPGEYNNNKYIDGGIYNNFLIRYAYDMFGNEKIIAFDILSNYSNVSNLLEYIYYLFVITYSGSRSIGDLMAKDNIKIIMSVIDTNMFVLPTDNDRGKNLILYSDLYISNYNRLNNNKIKVD